MRTTTGSIFSREAAFHRAIESRFSKGEIPPHGAAALHFRVWVRYNCEHWIPLVTTMLEDVDDWRRIKPPAPVPVLDPASLRRDRFGLWELVHRGEAVMTAFSNRGDAEGYAARRGMVLEVAP